MRSLFIASATLFLAGASVAEDERLRQWDGMRNLERIEMKVFLGDRYILLHPLVREDLKLDDETRARLESKVQEFREAYGRSGSRFDLERRLDEDASKHLRLGNPGRSYLELKSNEERAAMDELFGYLKRTLTEAHFRRLDQLAMQERGAWAFEDKAIIERLRISQTQSREIKEISRSKSPEITHSPRTREEKEKNVRLYGEMYDEILAKVLTEQQKRSWSEMVGEPLSPPFGKTPYIVLAEYWLWLDAD